MPGSYPWLLMTPSSTGTKRDPIWSPSIRASTYFSVAASLYLRIVLFLPLLSLAENSGICSRAVVLRVQVQGLGVWDYH